MSKLVCQGAVLRCSMGNMPCALNIVSNQTVFTSGRLAATINDFTPPSISTFGMCQSLANPTVATATSAASGVLTPQPCVPVITTPWKVGSPTVLIQNQIALNASATNICAYLGNISINLPGQVQTAIP